MCEAAQATGATGATGAADATRAVSRGSKEGFMGMLSMFQNLCYGPFGRSMFPNSVYEIITYTTPSAISATHAGGFAMNAPLTESLAVIVSPKPDPVANAKAKTESATSVHRQYQILCPRL